MMDLGMSELLVIGVVALIVIGPKDLPVLFRSIGKFTAKLRAMSREFSRAMEAAAEDTGIKDVAADLKKATSPSALGIDAVRQAADRFEKWDPSKGIARPNPAKLAESAQPAAAAAVAEASAAATAHAAAEDAGLPPAERQLKPMLSSAAKRADEASPATATPPKAENDA